LSTKKPQLFIVEVFLLGQQNQI